MRGSQLFTEERVRAAALVVLGSAIGLAASFVFGLPPSTLGSLGAATGALVSAALSVRGEKDALDARRTSTTSMPSTASRRTMKPSSTK
jgi:hypothetical protein